MKDLATMAYDAGVMPILFSNETSCVSRVISAIEQTGIPAVEILQRGEGAKEALKEAIRIKKHAYVGAGTVCTLDHGKEMVESRCGFSCVSGL